MILGFIGLPNSGKTTVFNAMTGLEAEVDYVHRSCINKAYIEVYDRRVVKLQEIYQPVKTTFAGVEVYDFAKSDDDRDNEYFDSHEAKLLDVTAFVLRLFDDEVIDIDCGLPDPVRDLHKLENEFILHDLIITEKRLEKLSLNLKRGVSNQGIPAEIKLLEKVAALLHKEIPVRELQLTDDENRQLKGFQLLSGKPILIIINCDEKNLEKSRQIEDYLTEQGYVVRVIVGKYETELLKLDENDRQLFLKEIGRERLAKERIIEAAYKALDYIHFYTIGKQEVKAWTIKRGLSALLAAGKIHSDMEKGFIRAECFRYDDLVEYGSEKALKEKGKFRLEGKTYQVEDGDILIIRFNK